MSECRNPGCTNAAGSDVYSRRFCSWQCEVSYDHIRDDARLSVERP